MKTVTHYLQNHGSGKSTAIAKYFVKHRDAVVVFANQQHKLYWLRTNRHLNLEEWRLLIAYDFKAFGMMGFLQSRGVKKIFFDEYLHCSPENMEITLNFYYNLPSLSDIEFIMYSTAEQPIAEEAYNILLYQAYCKQQASYNYAKFITKLFWKAEIDGLDLINKLEEEKRKIELFFLNPIRCKVINKMNKPYMISLSQILENQQNLLNIGDCVPPLASLKFY